MLSSLRRQCKNRKYFLNKIKNLFFKVFQLSCSCRWKTENVFSPRSKNLFWHFVSRNAHCQHAFPSKQNWSIWCRNVQNPLFHCLKKRDCFDYIYHRIQRLMLHLLYIRNGSQNSPEWIFVKKMVKKERISYESIVEYTGWGMCWQLYLL